jgi:hypothetical protein
MKNSHAGGHMISKHSRFWRIKIKMKADHAPNLVDCTIY